MPLDFISFKKFEKIMKIDKTKNMGYNLLRALCYDKEFQEYFKGKHPLAYSNFVDRKDVKTCKSCLRHWGSQFISAVRDNTELLEKIKEAVSRNLPEDLPDFIN